MFRHPKSLALLAFTLTLPLVAPAAVLTKLNEPSRRAVVSGPELEFARVGDRIRVGENCELVIDRKLSDGDNRVGVQTASCTNRSALQIGAEGALISVVGDQAEGESAAERARSRLSSRALMKSNRRVSVPREEMMKGLGVGLIFGNMNKDALAKEVYEMPGGGSVYNALENENSSNGAAGLNLNYSHVPRMGFGFTGDVALSQVQQIISEQPYLYLRPAANLAYGFKDKFYFSGGLNYMMFLQQPKYVAGVFEGQSISLKPAIGWQVGAGMVLNQNWQGQLQYTQANQTMDQQLNTEDIGSLKSARVVGDYSFTSIEMTLQYRF